MHALDSLPSLGESDLYEDDGSDHAGSVSGRSDPGDCVDELLADLGICLGSGDALAALPASGASKRPLGLYTGDLYRSRQHTMYLQQCKRSRKLERDAAAREAVRAPLEAAWNTDRLRFDVVETSSGFIHAC